MPGNSKSINNGGWKSFSRSTGHKSESKSSGTSKDWGQNAYGQMLEPFVPDTGATAESQTAGSDSILNNMLSSWNDFNTRLSAKLQGASDKTADLIVKGGQPPDNTVSLQSRFASKGQSEFAVNTKGEVVPLKHPDAYGHAHALQQFTMPSNIQTSSGIFSGINNGHTQTLVPPAGQVISSIPHTQQQHQHGGAGGLMSLTNLKWPQNLTNDSSINYANLRLDFGQAGGFRLSNPEMVSMNDMTPAKADSLLKSLSNNEILKAFAQPTRAHLPGGEGLGGPSPEQPISLDQLKTILGEVKNWPTNDKQRKKILLGIFSHSPTAQKLLELPFNQGLRFQNDLGAFVGAHSKAEGNVLMRNNPPDEMVGAFGEEISHGLYSSEAQAKLLTLKIMKELENAGYHLKDATADDRYTTIIGMKEGAINEYMAKHPGATRASAESRLDDTSSPEYLSLVNKISQYLKEIGYPT